MKKLCVICLLVIIVACTVTQKEKGSRDECPNGYRLVKGTFPFGYQPYTMEGCLSDLFPDVISAVRFCQLYADSPGLTEIQDQGFKFFGCQCRDCLPRDKKEFKVDLRLEEDLLKKD